MKTLSLAIAALALSAGMAAAQGSPTSSGERPETSGSRTTTDLGADRTDKSGTEQGYNTGRAGEDVGAQRSINQAETMRTDGSDTAYTDRRATGGRRSGVATGFIAAGFGLALLGLFARRRARHPDDRYDDPNRTTRM